MLRRATPARITDERCFQFRVRFERPGSGIWRVEELHDWLRQRLGRNGYAIHGADWNVIGTVFAVDFDNETVLTDKIGGYLATRCRPHSFWFHFPAKASLMDNCNVKA